MGTIEDVVLGLSRSRILDRVFGTEVPGSPVELDDACELDSPEFVSHETARIEFVLDGVSHHDVGNACQKEGRHERRGVFQPNFPSFVSAEMCRHAVSQKVAVVTPRLTRTRQPPTKGHRARMPEESGLVQRAVWQVWAGTSARMLQVEAVTTVVCDISLEVTRSM